MPAKKKKNLRKKKYLGFFDSKKIKKQISKKYKTWNKNIRWKVFEQTLSETIERFPLTIVALGVLFLTALFYIHTLDMATISNLGIIKVIMTSTFLVWLSISAQLLAESYRVTELNKRIKIYTGALVLALIYYIWIPDSIINASVEVISVHMLVHGALFLSTRFSLFTKQLRTNKYKDTEMYSFNIQTAGAIIESFLVGLALSLFGVATLASIDALFDVTLIQEDRYLEWILFSVVLVAPCYFLSKIPHANQLKLKASSHTQQFLRFFILYCTLPFIAIYFLVLYAYTIQVIATMVWPQGVIVWMVTFFSFFGWGIYVLSFQERKNNVVKYFRTWFPIIILPQLAMLFYAIWLRISQHGVTVNRYLVVCFGLWLTGISLYYIVSKNKYLVAIPGSLAASILIIIIGPWSMFAVSEQSQLRILEERMLEIGVIDSDGAITKLSQDQIVLASEQHAVSIPSIIRYLCNYHGCHTMQELFREDHSSKQEKFETTSGYTQARHLISLTGLPEYAERISSDGEKYLSYYREPTSLVKDVSSYRTLLFVDTYRQTQQDDARARIQNIGSGMILNLDLESQSYTFNITSQIDELLRTVNSIESSQIKTDFKITQGDISILVVPWSLSGLEQSNGKIKERTIEALLLVDY